MDSKNSNSKNKKIIVRSLLSVLLFFYFVFVVPNQVITIIKYFQLKGQVNTLDLEIQALAGSLMSAKDVDTVVRNSGYKIKLCSIMDSINKSNVKTYNGEDVSDGTSKVLEYIIETKDDISYLLSYLSGYKISYSSIVLSDSEIVLQIYCN